MVEYVVEILDTSKNYISASYMESLLNMTNNTDPNTTTGLESFNHSVAIMCPKWQNTASTQYSMRIYATYINHTTMKDEKVSMESKLVYNKPELGRNRLQYYCSKNFPHTYCNSFKLPTITPPINILQYMAILL
jgi:hypothetical protein